jgi:hypothetical protein
MSLVFGTRTLSGVDGLVETRISRGLLVIVTARKWFETPTESRLVRGITIQYR